MKKKLVTIGLPLLVLIGAFVWWPRDEPASYPDAADDSRSVRDGSDQNPAPRSAAPGLERNSAAMPDEGKNATAGDSGSSNRWSYQDAFPSYGPEQSEQIRADRESYRFRPR